MYNHWASSRFTIKSQKQNRQAYRHGALSVHCVALFSMSVDLSTASSLNNASFLSVLCLSSFVSLSFVSLNFLCPGDSGIRQDTVEKTRKGILAKAVVRQLVWSRDLEKNTVDKIQSIRFKTFIMHEVWNRKTTVYCLKHNLELVQIIKIIIVQSKYGIYVQIIITSSTNKYLIP